MEKRLLSYTLVVYFLNGVDIVLFQLYDGVMIQFL